ncbi:hypothetical protein M434DRAFT_65172, partial [Hypoxylon sp. CO27-5]
SGIVIDLRDLNSISVDKPSGIAQMGSRNTWGRVYAFLEDYGLAATGGRQKDVRVEGFTLGVLSTRIPH